MANSFWNFVSALVPGTLAKAEDVNTNLAGVAAGFDAVETITDQVIKITNSPGTVAIALNASSRANKLVAFDINGDIAASQILGDWKGDHANAAGTDYEIRDVVRDAAGAIGLNNLYICNTTHTSTGTLATDTANWDLLVDATVGDAAQVGIADTGGYFTGTDAEAALQEIGAKTQHITVTQAVDLDTMETNIAANNAKVTNATHTGEVTGSGALTVQPSAISGKTALASGLADTDEFLVNDAGVLKRMDASVLKEYLYGTTVTNHVRAGNTQIWNGLDSVLTLLDVRTNITEATFESVGPTGSGATNIWTALDNLPSSARILIALVEISITTDADGLDRIRFFAASNDISPVVDSGSNLLADTGVDVNATAGIVTTITEVMIPLDSNQVFKCTWSDANTGSSPEVILRYQGFIVD